MSKTDGSELASLWAEQIAFGNRSIDCIYDHANKHVDISKKEIKYFLLLTTGPRTQSELSMLCATNQANTARAIDSLIEKGLVQMGDRVNGRSYTVILTEKGREISSHVLSTLARTMALTFDDVTEEEYQAAIKVLLRIQKSL